MDKQKYRLEKLARRKTGFPIATIAYYGPDQNFASKVVVGIRMSEKEEEVSELHKWFATDRDVRADTRIVQEMVAYIEANKARRVVMVEQIFGCPHEEGIDYPMGESCPQCPYWKNRDRFTGELIS